MGFIPPLPKLSSLKNRIDAFRLVGQPEYRPSIIRLTISVDGSRLQTGFAPRYGFHGGPNQRFSCYGFPNGRAKAKPIRRDARHFKNRRPERKNR
jgi:hypothetical protein